MSENKLVESIKGNFTIKMFGHRFHIIFDKLNNIVIAKFNTVQENGKDTFDTGIAKCNPDDKFSTKYGTLLAVKRCICSYYSYNIGYHTLQLKKDKTELANFKSNLDNRMKKLAAE